MGELWGTEKIELGTVTQPMHREFARDFSSAVSLVVTVSITNFTPRERFALEWRIYDSVDGSNLWALEDTYGSYRGSAPVGGHNAQTRRFVVPFGPKLSLGLHPFNPRKDGEPVPEGSFEGVVATLFWRGIG